MPKPNPPPQPESVTAASDASMRIARVAHLRLCRMVLRNNQNSGSIASDATHADRSPVDVAVAAVCTVSCEVADEEPGETDAGWNAAVAPGGSPLAERVTALGKVPFCAATVMVYCALPPAVMVCVAVLDERVNVGIGGAVPVPLSATDCGEPVALSVTETVALKLAAEAGVKVMAMLHVAPAVRELPHVSVSAKAVGLAPTIAMLPIVSAALPVFLSEMLWAALVVPVLVVKVSVEGESETAGVGIAEKLAMTLCAAFIVMVVEALVVLATLPVQLLNWKPALGVAERFTTVPEG